MRRVEARPFRVVAGGVVSSTASASWLELAAGRGSPTSLWFSRRPFDVAIAVAVCTSCPVRGECLADAFELEPAATGSACVAG